MRRVNQLTDNKFVNLFEVYDPEHHVKGFQFAERRGVDSVAFVCYDEGPEQILLGWSFNLGRGH